MKVRTKMSNEEIYLRYITRHNRRRNLSSRCLNLLKNISIINQKNHKQMIRQILWILLGSIAVSIPYALATSIISLNAFGLVALGMGLGVLLFVAVFVAIWNNT